MASLYKKNVLIRGNSTITLGAAITWTKNWVNTFQERDENKDENGNYIAYYYADLFDSRVKKLLYVFSDAAVNYYSMDAQWFTVIDMSQVVKTDMVTGVSDDYGDKQLMIPTVGAVGDIIGIEIRKLKIVNDFDVINDGRMPLSMPVYGDIIGGACQVKVYGNIYDTVDAHVENGELVIDAADTEQYEGKMCLVSYLTRQ